MLLLAFAAASGQTSIRGVVNSYYRVVEVLPAKGCVRVDNPAGLVSNNRTMLIQMKGASVNTTNSSSFGTVTAVNEAGNYELNTVCAIRGDSVFFMQGILHSYSVANKVQLVRIPLYASAVVSDTLKALPWDSTTGKGGVLAISVEDDLILQAPIWGAGTGYLGGSYVMSSGTCSNFTPASSYVYNPTNLNPQSGSWKGEGIASILVANAGGRAPNGNGGGGGNNHNNGGGGGANLTAGGIGGGNSSTAGCTSSFPGMAGYALTSGGTKVFMGGGGGAGHANGTLVTGGGGRGGGVLFIQANNLISNGRKIAANGAKGGNALGDGSSGGGAGGTIIMDVVNYADVVRIEAIGGDGGNQNDDNISGRCYGEGGGGSGGVIYLRGSTPPGTLLVNGGIKGTKTGSVGCATLIAAAPGSAGSIVNHYSYQRSSTITTCAVVLPVKFESFRALQNLSKALLEWQVSHPETVRKFEVERRMAGSEWMILGTLEALSAQRAYQFDDAGLSPGAWQYRVKVLEHNGASFYSSVRSINMSVAASSLQVHPNPSFNTITITGTFSKGDVLQLFDATGRMVMERSIPSASTSIQQDISMLRCGIYLIKAGSGVTRLVKN